jgi:hypothetical protein
MKSIQKEKGKENQDPSPAAINRSHTQGRPEDERNGGNRQHHTTNTRKNTKQNRNPYSTQSKGTHTFTPSTKIPPSLQRKNHNMRRKKRKSTCGSRSNTKKSIAKESKETPETLPPKARDGDSRNSCWTKRKLLRRKIVKLRRLKKTKNRVRKRACNNSFVKATLVQHIDLRNAWALLLSSPSPQTQSANSARNRRSENLCYFKQLPSACLCHPLTSHPEPYLDEMVHFLR